MKKTPWLPKSISCICEIMNIAKANNAQSISTEHAQSMLQSLSNFVHIIGTHVPEHRQMPVYDEVHKILGPIKSITRALVEGKAVCIDTQLAQISNCAETLKNFLPELRAAA